MIATTKQEIHTVQMIEFCCLEGGHIRQISRRWISFMQGEGLMQTREKHKLY